jgi:4-oxalocrotonate tautomerase family enzyme
MKKKAAERITDIIVEELKAKKEDVRVVYQDIDKENWCIGGKMF